MSTDKIQDTWAKHYINKQQTELRKHNDQLEKNDRAVAAMKQENQKLEQMMKEQGQEQKNERSKIISSMSRNMRDIEQKIKRETENANSKIDNVRQILSHHISKIEQKEENKRNIALAILKDTQDAVALISTHNHQKFKPGKYEKLLAELSIIESNLENGMFEAAVSNAQQTMQRAYFLRIELAKIENEWNSYKQIAFEANNKLIADCQASEIIKYVYEAEDETTHDIKLEVDHWSYGELSKLHESAKEHKESIENNQALSVDDFKAMIEQSKALEDRVAAIVEEAQMNMLTSQLRNDMAEDIEDVLYESGFEVVESVYEGDDYRQPFRIKFRNSIEDEIITIITQSEGQKISLSHHFYEKTYDPGLNMQRIQGISEKIEEATGIQLGSPKEAEAEFKEHRENGEIRDFKKAKKEKKALMARG